MTAWFDVDKNGLGQLMARLGRERAVLEIASNALDTQARRIQIELASARLRGYSRLVVADDDPNGFQNLTDAWTLFAPSSRKADATKRGRFNLGEKLALALCREAEIRTVSGSVVFDAEGRRRGRRRTASGSSFSGRIRLNADERAKAIDLLRSVIVPEGVVMTVNGVLIATREPLATGEATLQTEVATEDGVLCRRRRKTSWEIYEPLPNERPTIYELGIPVVETGDRYHVNIGQKVPLNMDRDNVTPAYLRRIRALALDAMRDQLDERTATESWVTDALESPELGDESVKAVVAQRFGRRRVIADPSDTEATRLAVTKGYTVIHGGALSSTAWGRVKESGAALPAGQVTPPARPQSSADGKDCRVPRDTWTTGMRVFVDYASWLGRALLGHTITVDIENWAGTSNARFAAAYGGNRLTYNLGKLGRAWFDADPSVDDERLERAHRLTLHELAHDAVSDHLSHDFHEECCRLGAKLAGVLRSRERASRRPHIRDIMDIKI